MAFDPNRPTIKKLGILGFLDHPDIVKKHNGHGSADFVNWFKYDRPFHKVKQDTGIGSINTYKNYKAEWEHLEAET